MSRHINAAAVLPCNAEQLRCAVHKALQAVYQARVRRLGDGGLSLSLMREEDPLVIEIRDNDIGIVISYIATSIGDLAHHIESISKLPIFAVFCYKRVNFISRPENA